MLLFVAGCSTNAHLKSTASHYTLMTGGELPELQKGLTVKHVELHFDVFPKKKTIVGKTKFTFKSIKPISTMSLDLYTAFKIKEVKFNQQVLSKDDYQNLVGELVIQLPEEVIGQFNLEIHYEGKPYVALTPPWDGGFVWSKTSEGHDWIATAVQGGGCDLFWPCIDNPLVEPESADIYFTVDKSLVAASNGLLQSVSESNGRKTYHWRSLNSINNYAISVNIGPYQLLTDTYQSHFGNALDLVYYHIPRTDSKDRQLFSEIPAMLDFFEQMIGPYPFGNEKVGVVDTPYLGMEHQTINGYGNGFKKNGYGFDTILQHEFAHEWFGNQLTNNNLDHLWLQEGFGTYMQPLYAQYLNGERTYQSYLQSLREGIVNKFPLVSNKVLNDDEVYNDEKGPGQDLYQKGALLLHTLRQLIGDDAFFSATRELVYGMPDPKPGMFTPRLSDTNEFIQIVNKTTGKDYQWFFDVYLFQAPLPTLEQNRDSSKLTLKWKVENDLPFPMPLDVSINGKVRTLGMKIEEVISVQPKDVVIIDPMSKVLRHEKAIDDYLAYKEEAEEEN